MAARRVVIGARTLQSNRVETNGNKPKTVKTGKDTVKTRPRAERLSI